MNAFAGADNVYLIDTNMFGFAQYHSAYMVVGGEIALIDTGTPVSWSIVREAIAALGLAPGDIAHVFVTHAEHPDHSGNVGSLLRENDRAVVYVSPLGAEFLTAPVVESERRKKNLSPSMAARFGEMQPVPASRLRLVADGDTVDLGKGLRLRVVSTPGHQPSGFVVFEEKHGGLFINDLCGAYFADAEASWIFTPYRSDVRQALASLGKVESLSAERLFLGHFGISENPHEVLERSRAAMQTLLDLAAECVRGRRPEAIEEEVLGALSIECEKMGKVRGPALYGYLKDELFPSLARAFATYYLSQPEA